ncbi:MULTISPECIES: hypothetical protein [Syntrophotalea]
MARRPLCAACPVTGAL